MWIMHLQTVVCPSLHVRVKILIEVFLLTLVKLYSSLSRLSKAQETAQIFEMCKSQTYLGKRKIS